jgi:manganese transport protein
LQLVTDDMKPPANAMTVAPGARPAASSIRLAGMVGPAALVSVGYMDPGNWATDLEGGARFGYQLIWVLLLSNVIALLLQNLSARLGIVSGLDLAAACRAQYSRGWVLGLWLLAEAAIVACDLAEILGGALALNLLFGIPLLLGAALTALDALLILMLQRRGARALEAVVIVLTGTVGLCLLIEVCLARPSAAALVSGAWPRLNRSSLPVAVGILGATVMPHNLYLQSALVPHGVNPTVRPRLLRRCFWTTALALNLALLVNGAILVVAAAVFFTRGIPVTDLRDAHALLSPLLGTGAASLLLAVGLLCSGQSATVSGTLAGQVVMEGFLGLRLSPWLRRLITRALAIIPALAVLAWFGDRGVTPLLIGSQVLLSLQLPFAVIPLIKLTNCPSIMGVHTNSRSVRLGAGACAVLIIVANAALVESTIVELRAVAPRLAIVLSGVGLTALISLAWLGSLRLRSAGDSRPEVCVHPKLERQAS